jgi:hypothetical protein
MPDRDIQEQLEREKERRAFFDKGVADALARNIDRLNPLPTDDRIRQLVRDEVERILKTRPDHDDIRRVAEDVALTQVRDMLGAIGLDVSDRQSQARTAAEMARWRETQATLKSVAMKILLSAAGAIGASLGIFFTFWQHK